jgi:hypothetical protein
VLFFILIICSEFALILSEKVPHRHIVFTIPKLLRRPFFHQREALNVLSRIAWDCVKTFMRDALGEGTPADAQAIETAGEYLEPNPPNGKMPLGIACAWKARMRRSHIHVIAADGLFADDGTFRPLRGLDEGAHHYLLSLWKKAVAASALKACPGRGILPLGTPNAIHSIRHEFICPEMMGKVVC